MDDFSVPPSGPLSRALTVDAREFVRVRSKILFGNRDRVEVAVAIARSPDRAVNATDLGYSIAMSTNRVRAQLLDLTAAGLLTESPVRGTSNTRYFLRGESPFWSAVVAVYDSWSLGFEPR